METLSTPLIEWGVAASTLAGQTLSGDCYVVQPFANGVLVAVIDGLGHGPQAAAAAALAARTLERHARESVISIVRACHEQLRGTRGAVLSVASFSACHNTMTWVGVGNVEGLLLREHSRGSERVSGLGDEGSESLLLRGGVIGARLPTLGAVSIPVSPGDTLVLASDGVRSDFAHGVVCATSAQQTAERILAEHAKTTDDALVLVSRYLGHEGTLHGWRTASG